MNRQTAKLMLERKEARKRLMADITKTQIALETAYSNFENVSDPDLIDSYIYELNSIQLRYQYLIRQMKEFELTMDALNGKIGNKIGLGDLVHETSLHSRNISQF